MYGSTFSHSFSPVATKFLSLKLFNSHFSHFLSTPFIISRIDTQFFNNEIYNERFTYQNEIEIFAKNCLFSKSKDHLQPGNGGFVIENENSILYFEQCFFSGCNSDNYGGAIFSNGKNCTILSSCSTGCAANNGAFIFLNTQRKDDSVFYMETSYSDDSQLPDESGVQSVIFSTNSQNVVKNSNFSKNSVAIAVKNHRLFDVYSPLVIEFSDFSNASDITLISAIDSLRMSFSNIQQKEFKNSSFILFYKNNNFKMNSNNVIDEENNSVIIENCVFTFYDLKLINNFIMFDFDAKIISSSFNVPKSFAPFSISDNETKWEQKEQETKKLDLLVKEECDLMVPKSPTENPSGLNKKTIIIISVVSVFVIVLFVVVMFVIYQCYCKNDKSQYQSASQSYMSLN